MITYKYIAGDTLFVKVIDDSKESNEFVNTQTNEAYLKWLSEGNTPIPAEEQGA